MLKANYHTHTIFCDGTNTAEEMVSQALELGFEHLGFSGHMDPEIHMAWPDYVAEVSRLKEKYAGQLDIIMGVELDNMYDPASCPGAEYVIGSTHFLDLETPEPWSVDNTPQIFQTLCRDYFGGDYYALSRAYYELEAKVYDRLGCTFVGHFDLVTRFNDELRVIDETSRAYLDPALEAMEYLVGEGVPFEINCGALNRNRKAELYPRTELLRALHDFGGEILINADAHQRELLDGGFDVAVERAIAAGFTHVNILAHDMTGNVEFRQLALDNL